MSITRPKLVASELLLEAVKRHNIHLSLLVADTGLWVNPEFHNRLVRDTGSAAIFPSVRRAGARARNEVRSSMVCGLTTTATPMVQLSVQPDSVSLRRGLRSAISGLAHVMTSAITQRSPTSFCYLVHWQACPTTPSRYKRRSSTGRLNCMDGIQRGCSHQ